MKTKSLVEQLYEVTAAKHALDRQSNRIKARLSRRIKPGGTVRSGHFFVTLCQVPEREVAAHVRKASLLWRVGVD